jgi:hypothetical protein
MSTLEEEIIAIDIGQFDGKRPSDNLSAIVEHSSTATTTTTTTTTTAATT